MLPHSHRTQYQQEADVEPAPAPAALPMTLRSDHLARDPEPHLLPVGPEWGFEDCRLVDSLVGLISIHLSYMIVHKSILFSVLNSNQINKQKFLFEYKQRLSPLNIAIKRK